MVPSLRTYIWSSTNPINHEKRRGADQNVRNVGSLTMNNRLPHYTCVHMLCSWGSNFSLLVYEDVFMLWCLKNNIMINWPHYIMQHMIKWISLRSMVCGNLEGLTMNINNNTKTFHCLKNMLQTTMLTQIWEEIQNIHESMSSLRLNINTINTRLGQIEDTLYQLQDNEEHWLYFYCVIIIIIIIYVELILIVS